ncbi:MAG: H-NS histone family protein [Rubrivivax sp.]|jgi:DNA-binding protein H-NS|nr:H-NS histone family protein [Rubrivivax sp.]
MTKLSLHDLLAQKAALDKQIADTQRAERAEAVAQVRALMAQYGLTLADIGAKAAAAPKRGTGAKVAAKYRDPATGNAWSGRGLQPKWLKAALEAGRSLSEFAVR